MLRITVLPGDGIGPEVTDEAVRVLHAAADRFGFEITLRYASVGGAALDEFDTPLPESTFEACKTADAVLLGAIGGPKWDHETGDRRCEAALLGLRKRLGVFANLRPVLVPQGQSGRSPIRADLVEGTDIMIIRELTGGIYFGRPRQLTQSSATNSMVYQADEIRRIARIAFRWAEKRQGRVTSVDKANVLEVSQLWRQVVTQLHQDEFAHIELNHLYVDNAAMQLVLNPKQFDVILTGNLFGDILSDLAATLPGSLGLLPSASLGGDIGLFEPVHGSAPDIVGHGIANPSGTILSAAMMLDALDLHDAAQAIRDGVLEALASGVCTRDLGGTASSAAFTDAVIQEVQAPVTAVA